MFTLDAEVTNSSLKQDVILTSDNWPIIVNFDLTAYEDATTTLRKDLAGVGEIARYSAPIGELRNVGTALSSLENKLGDLKGFLPEVDRRGLINTVGSILKLLFGTDTLMDIDGLHATIDVMERKEDDIVHSLNQHVTYLKQLVGTVRFNYQVICNLSTTLKGVALKAEERFKEVASRLTRNNRVIEATAVIRHLDFPLTQLEKSIDEFVNAMQFVHLGRTPLNLFSPTMLRELLKNGK
jgi:hypothetical protein